MPATIKIKNSSTSGAVPTASDLVQGELAVNVADLGLYTENASGTVVKLNAPSIDDKNTGATKHLTISTGGNLGLGVTPSAWASSYKALDVGNTASLYFDSSGAVVSNNSFINSSFQYRYKTSNAATRYEQTSAGQHQWFNAASGTAGNAITFTQAMTLDASGNLGIGTTSPAISGYLLANIKGGASTAPALSLDATSASGGRQFLILTAGSPNNALIVYDQTAAAERARIDSSGNLLVGTTSALSSGKISVAFDGTPSNALVLRETAGYSGAGYVVFQNPAGSTIGSITRVALTNAVAYNTTSDQRLKSNIEDSAPVLDKLMDVKVRQYDWTEGELHQDYGFVAQELEPLLSGIVTKGKTEEDIWQLDYSRLTPHLLKAIQEQQAIIETLTARIEALEAA
jgi:hypothetical protein